MADPASHRLLVAALFSHALVRSYGFSSFNPFIHSFVVTPIHHLIHSFIDSFAHLRKFIHSFIHSLTRYFFISTFPGCGSRCTVVYGTSRLHSICDCLSQGLSLAFGPRDARCESRLVCSAGRCGDPVVAVIPGLSRKDMGAVVATLAPRGP